MKEEVEIRPEGDGGFAARVCWQHFAAEIKLPSGFEGWEPEEQRAHLRRHVVPRLRYMVGRARLGLTVSTFEGETVYQNEADRRALEQAALKRARRAEKRRARLS